MEAIRSLIAATRLPARASSAQRHDPGGSPRSTGSDPTLSSFLGLGPLDRRILRATNLVAAMTDTVLTATLGGLVLVLLAGASWLGRDYYRLTRSARPGHELHDLLAPGAPLGVALGLAGTGLMIAMLLYSVRKLRPRARWMGSTRFWLRFHVLCGAGGAALIVLHAGWLWPDGLVAVAFWCMVAVALSGAAGRYLVWLAGDPSGDRPSRGSRLLRLWRLLHRPLAAAMYVIVALHVLSAVVLGGSLTRLAEVAR